MIVRLHESCRMGLEVLCGRSERRLLSNALPTDIATRRGPLTHEGMADYAWLKV